MFHKQLSFHNDTSLVFFLAVPLLLSLLLQCLFSCQSQEKPLLLFVRKLKLRFARAKTKDLAMRKAQRTAIEAGRPIDCIRTDEELIIYTIPLHHTIAPYPITLSPCLSQSLTHSLHLSFLSYKNANGCHSCNDYN